MNPWYQKEQVGLIGIGLATITGIVICMAVVDRDWHTIKQILLFIGTLLVMTALLVGFVWAMVKILTRKHANDPNSDENAEG